MTRPPDDRWDPNRENPETRRFEPSDETSAYGPDDRTAPYDQSAPYGQTEHYGQTEPYGQPPSGYGPPPGYGPPQAYTEAASYGPGYGPDGPAPGGPDDPQPPKKNTGRTVGLALAIVAALVVLALVGVLIARGSNDDGGDTAAASSTSSEPSTTPSRSTTTTTTTTEETTTTTTPAVPPGEVVYQLTGNGDVIGIRFRNGSRSTVVAAAGTPWSQAATVTGSSAELTAIVIRGPVTCNILRGEDLLSSSTSNGGPLRCAASLG